MCYVTGRTYPFSRGGGISCNTRFRVRTVVVQAFCLLCAALGLYPLLSRFVFDDG